MPAIVSSKISSVETLIVALPTRREHKWTGLTERIGRYLLVKMTDDAGHVGWGEAPALKDWGGEFGRYFGESAAIVQLVIDRYLAPAVAGIPVGNIGLLHQKMDAVIKGYPYAKAAMDFAAYDLSGRASGLPVYTLLGGAVRDSVSIAHSIGLIGIEDAERKRRKSRRKASRRSRSRSASSPSATSRWCASSVPRSGRCRALRRCQRRLQDAGRGHPHHPQDGTLRPEICRAAGHGHRADGRSRARRSTRR